MAVVTLRQVGGSLSFAVPPSIKESLGLAAGLMLEVSADKGAMVARPKKPKYTLAELLAQCDPSVPYTDEERAWIDAPPVGREVW